MKRIKLIKDIIEVCALSIILIAIVLFIVVKLTPRRGFVSILYDKQEHTVIFSNQTSWPYFSKAYLDMDGDTLIINVQEKSVFLKPIKILKNPTAKIRYTSWKIHLAPNVGYMRFGRRSSPLSVVNPYPDPIARPKPDEIIEVFPDEYPYEYK
jgi:hypothetical protein